jgi:GNAT superfamily N-acetyltransferase
MTSFTEAMQETWPPAATTRLGPWLLRCGNGGGKRVSAATLQGDFDESAIADAQAAMQRSGQRPLFQIGLADDLLDAALARRGYTVVDPVLIYAATLADLAAAAPPPMTTFPHWPPLEIAVDLWAEGGIDAQRLAVIHRVQGAKSAILARASDRVAGVAFVAAHAGIAMLHALEVTPPLRRQGSARHILQAAAQWAGGVGATRLGLAVTRANAAACTLYASFGMRVVGQYHYRQL